MRNHEVQGFVNYLITEELSGKFSRMRTRFVKLAQKQIDQIEQERIELVKNYAEKDEHDNPIILTHENGSTSYKVNDMEGFNVEYAELMNEVYIIDETDERREMLECVKHVVLNTIKMFKGQEALDYDRWCDIVEDILE